MAYYGGGGGGGQELFLCCHLFTHAFIHLASCSVAALNSVLYPLRSGACPKSHSPISPGPSEEAESIWNQKGNKSERRAWPYPGEVGPITKL